METKLILVRECKKFEGPGRAGEENWVPLIKRELKLLVLSPWKLTAGNCEIAAISTETKIHGFKRSYYFKYDKVFEEK